VNIFGIHRLGCLWLVLASAPAVAEDTWSDVREGVRHLHRVTTGSLPQDLHAVSVDLTLDNVGVRASMDLSGSERWVTTSTFADSTDALIAVNGDWGLAGTTQPLSLAIGNGFLWNDHYDDAGVGGTWGYFACDVFNHCEMDWLAPLSEVWWFQPTLSPYRYYNAVGANGVPLIQDGVRGSGCFDGDTCPAEGCRHPRTAVCTTEDEDTLWFMVVDGRRTDASGMTCDEVRDLAEELGCHSAAMLDGGGSSTMFIDGSVRNEPSDGTERVRPNHVGIVYNDGVDAECELAAGAWCDGSVLNTCNGGRLVNSGDCAAFGSSCEEDGSWAYCVHFLCPDGDGMGTRCLDHTTLRSCTDGQLSEGDCGLFGTVCGEDGSGASCMDSRCEGPETGFCLDDDTRASCAAGVYTETACAAGEVCTETGDDASCDMPATSDGDADTDTDTDTDTDADTDADTDTDADADADQTNEPFDTGSTGTSEDEKGDGCGCATASNTQGWVLILLGLLSGVRRRRFRGI
jgi:MYXO-CTERM domain-containing protein